MTERGKQNVIKSLRENIQIANRPDRNNNILIKNNVIYLIKDGCIIKERCLHIAEIVNFINSIYLDGNIFENSNAKYSPLEADKLPNKSVWLQDYNHIDFPKFMPVILFSLIETSNISSFNELSQIYSLVYTEPIKDNLFKPDRLFLYAISVKNNADRNRLGKTLIYDGVTYQNKLLSFKPEFEQFIRGLPINEFTTEQLFSRIYKGYASLIRDIVTPFLLTLLGAEVEYDYYKDINGIDCIVNDIPVFANVKTKNSNYFGKIKIENRHPELNNVNGIRLQMDKNNKNKSNKIYLPDEETAKRVIDYSNKLKNNELTGIQSIIF